MSTRRDRSRAQRSSSDHWPPQLGANLDRDALVADFDSLGMDDSRSAHQDQPAARPPRSSREQSRPREEGRSLSRSRLARVSGGVTPPVLDPSAFRSWGEDAEFIELTAINAVDDTQKRAFARKFVSNGLFRTRVLEADQMYRSRRTVYDYHHAGGLRECILTYGGSGDISQAFPVDREMNSVFLDANAVQQVLAARPESNDQPVGTGNLRGFMTGLDGNPTQQDVMEFTITPAAARVATLQYQQRMRARSEADAANRRRAAAARRSPTSSVRAHTGRSSDSSAGGSGRPNHAAAAERHSSGDRINQPLEVTVSRRDVQRMSASSARHASTISMQAHTGKSSSSGSSSSVRSGDAPGSSTRVGTLPEVQQGDEGGRSRRPEKRGDELFKGIFGRKR